jgi:hypothetical protein
MLHPRPAILFFLLIITCVASFASSIRSIEPLFTPNVASQEVQISANEQGLIVGSTAPAVSHDFSNIQTNTAAVDLGSTPGERVLANPEPNAFGLLLLGGVLLAGLSIRSSARRR